MLLREAVSSLPDRAAARRVAIVVTALTAGVLVGGAHAMYRRTQIVSVVPAIRIASVEVAKADRFERTGVASSEDIALAKDELNRYRHLFYSQWVMANPGRSCPARLLEINRFDARLHAVDPWGTPYQFLCGAQYRPTFQLRSAGFDGVFDTQDDLTP